MISFKWMGLNVLRLLLLSSISNHIGKLWKGKYNLVLKMSMDRRGKDNMKCQLVERAVKIIWGQTSRYNSKCKRSKLGERGRKYAKSGQTYLGKKWEEKKERRNKAKKASAWGTSLGCCRQAEGLEKRKAVILPIAVNSCNVWMVPRAQVWFDLQVLRWAGLRLNPGCLLWRSLSRMATLHLPECTIPFLCASLLGFTRYQQSTTVKSDNEVLQTS